ncbi:class II fructose-bisphosphatase [Methanosalsum natronophilum]|uniref:Fructose-1,6-bisphosphatase n=1 Tax=Methanosalsum natronophilum TaxID=768733 RepID=A0A3R7VZD9_9EURY|nr:class II fructose-bisphosphatase [Methanosalsum natronophilum]MCS3924167.1 fructose-1,6-bisphosphatase II [Methanosalsum natronophilum]RQD92464.1 MAG: class II fructose-bisphosphatase [Methanosalsum natronophilum]
MEMKKNCERMMHNAGPIEQELLPRLVNVTEAAAIAAAHQIGRGQKNYADQVAVESMRRMLNSLAMRGTIKIGEGERDKAPMLYIGEHVGTGEGDLEVDIAVDPLEGTNLTADGVPGAISVMAMSEPGGLFHGPDVYMEKIVVGSEVVKYEKENPGERIDLDAPVQHNLEIVAKALKRDVEELVVVILDRPRHKGLIDEIRNSGARVNLITDGDLMPGVATSIRGSGVHIVMGSGGSGEAVLTAAAIKILGGKVLARLVLPSVANNKSKEDIEKEKREKLPRLEKMGIKEENINTILDTEKLVPGKDVIFAATGVTSGQFLRGANLFGEGDARVDTITMGSSGVVKFTDSIYIKNKETTPLRIK